MNSALQLLVQFEAITADCFPLGKQGTEILDQLEHVPDSAPSSDFYKAALTEEVKARWSACWMPSLRKGSTNALLSAPTSYRKPCK
jgi:hypothetical protein